MPRAKKKMDVAPTQYGEGAELDRAQDAVPAGPAVTDPVPFVSPDQVPNLSDPTMRPDEPVTTGEPFGPGAGPRPMSNVGDPVLETIRAMYMNNPSPHLRRMLRQVGGG